MQTRTAAALDPERIYTPNTLSSDLRELSGGRSIAGSRRIRHAIQTGDLPAYCIGGRYYVLGRDALEWLEGMRVEPELPPRDLVAERVEARLRREASIGA